MDEIQKFFMNSALGQPWSRKYDIFKFHQLFLKLLVMGGGGGGGGEELHLCFLFCKFVCVMINFSNVFCFSFVQ